jgi:hypothetical protein
MAVYDVLLNRIELFAVRSEIFKNGMKSGIEEMFHYVMSQNI